MLNPFDAGAHISDSVPLCEMFGWFQRRLRSVGPATMRQHRCYSVPLVSTMSACACLPVTSVENCASIHPAPAETSCRNHLNSWCHAGVASGLCCVRVPRVERHLRRHGRQSVDRLVDGRVRVAQCPRCSSSGFTALRSVRVALRPGCAASRLRSVCDGASDGGAARSVSTSAGIGSLSPGSVQAVDDVSRPTHASDRVALRPVCSVPVALLPRCTCSGLPRLCCSPLFWPARVLLSLSEWFGDFWAVRSGCRGARLVVDGRADSGQRQGCFFVVPQC